jgi:hypothetical protein
MQFSTLEYNIRKLICNSKLMNTNVVEFLHVTLTYMFADRIVNHGRILVMRTLVMVLCQEYPTNTKKLHKVEDYCLQQLLLICPNIAPQL